MYPGYNREDQSPQEDAARKSHQLAHKIFGGRRCSMYINSALLEDDPNIYCPNSLAYVKWLRPSRVGNNPTVRKIT